MNILYSLCHFVNLFSDYCKNLLPMETNHGLNGLTNEAQKCDRNILNAKRTDYLEWHEFFMATAMLVAKRSKDPVSQVGACIVNRENKIVGTGYNGMPLGCSDDEFPWGKSDKKLQSKHSYVCHAEMNAVLNKNSADVKDCIIYVGLFPCNECAKIIIQSGIREVIYLSDKHAHKNETIAAKRMFDATGIKYWQYKPKNEKLVIDFSEIDWNNQRQVSSTPSKPDIKNDIDPDKKIRMSADT